MKKILKFPNGPKQLTNYSCGTNCMRYVIYYYNGVSIPEEILMRIGNTSEKAGTSLPGMKRIADKFDLDYELKFNSSISDLVQLIKEENLAVLSVQAWPNRKIQSGGWKGINAFGHYVVAFGYDNKNEKLNYYDPFDGKNKTISYLKLEERWHDGDDHLGIFFKG